MTALVRLYPRAWRDRYEAEFLEVLVDRPPRWGDRLDILFAALDAHLHPEVPETDPGSDAAVGGGRGRPVAAGLAGIGGVLWLATVATMLLAPVDPDGHHDATPALVAFGLNTQTWYALLALPYAIAWMATAAWLLSERAPRPVDASRIG